MNLKELISKGESETLEFKESLKLKEEIGETVSAFSNSRGGKILVGVSDNGCIKGLQISEKTLRDLAEFIKRNTDPNVFTSIEVKEISSKKIMVIKVKELREKPVFFKNHAYKRVGSSNQRLTSSEMRKIAKEFGERVYWDEQICEKATLNDLEEDKIKWVIRQAKEQRGLGIEEHTSIREVLMRLKLLQENQLTNAAILLFCKNPQNFFMQVEVKCIRFKGRKVTEPIIDMKVIDGNVIDQVRETEKFIFNNIALSSWIEDWKIQRQEKWEYPPKAIREALVNAIAHRDYTTSSKVQVRIFEDRMEFWNPGKLPEGWNVEMLKKEHESIPFNPLIARIFFWIKYIEEVGTGTNKIIEWCKEWGLPEPIFEFTGTSLVVTLRKPLLKEEFAKLGLNERQIKAIEYVEKRGSITNREYQALNQVLKWTATRDLTELVKKGVFNQIGRGKRNLRYTVVSEQNAPKMRQKIRYGS